MDREERKIKELLSRMEPGKGPCPELDELTALLEGGLNPGEEEKVREHLSSCVNCRELARIGLELEDEVLGPASEKALLRAKTLFEPGLAQRAGRFLAGLVSGPREAVELKPAFSFRGNVAAKAAQGLAGYFQEFGSYRAEIEVEQIGEDQWQVLVWVFDRESKKPARGIRVSLRNRERELESLMVERGRAVFEPLPAGPYRMEFQKQGKVLAGILIRMKGEGK